MAADDRNRGRPRDCTPHLPTGDPASLCITLRYGFNATLINAPSNPIHARRFRD
jgi:hypothetical protein